MNTERAQFEAWDREHFSLPERYYERFGDGFNSIAVNARWATWQAARRADEALLREAAANLQNITAAYRKAVKLYDPNTDDAYSVDAHNAIAALRARLEGTTS